MTLREKVAEMEPDAINESEPGEVMCCPGAYEYLNDEKSWENCAFPCPTQQECDACWDREFVPKEEEKKMTLKEKVQLVSKLCRDQGKCDNCPVKQHSEEIGACTTNIFATESEERLDAMLKCFDGEECCKRQSVPVEDEEKMTDRKQLIEKFWELCGKFWGCSDGCPLNGTGICMHLDEKDDNEIQRVIDAMEAYLKMRDEADKVTEATKTPSAIDHPSHYNQGGVECIDAIKAATVGLNGFEGFCAGNALKYLWRWKHKNGVEDLKQCQWYLDMLIEEQEGKQ